MFEKLGRLAEGLATGVGTSRRGFLGRVGRSALGVAGALGALAVASAAQTGGVVCCKYECKRYHGSYSTTLCLAAGSTCATSFGGYYFLCRLQSSHARSDCSQC
jgi:hypothetical protein